MNPDPTLVLTESGPRDGGHLSLPVVVGDVYLNGESECRHEVVVRADRGLNRHMEW